MHIIKKVCQALKSLLHQMHLSFNSIFSFDELCEVSSHQEAWLLMDLEFMLEAVKSSWKAEEGRTRPTFWKPAVAAVWSRIWGERSQEAAAVVQVAAAQGLAWGSSNEMENWEGASALCYDGLQHFWDERGEKLKGDFRNSSISIWQFMRGQ